MEWFLRVGYKAARRIVVGVVGGTLVLMGVCMLVLPGPAFVVIPIGLGILGIEFAFARRWLRKIKEAAAATAQRFQGSDGSGEDREEATRDAPASGQEKPSAGVASGPKGPPAGVGS